MSMTVEEAMQILDSMKEPYCEEENEALNMAITALEEIQEFRKENITIQRALDMMCDLTCATEIIEEFEAIGTVSEFRELKEKATAKKPIYSDFDENEDEEIIPYKAVCPVCGYEFEFGTWNDEQNHHCECGQRMLWV